MNAIEVRRLTRRFGDFVAVNDLTFAVRQGEIFGFLGSNGAGKSTTIRMLCGLLRPTSGTALVGGMDVSRDPEGREAAHRLHVAALLAVREAHRRSEHHVLRRHLRAGRRSLRGAPRVRARHGRPPRPGVDDDRERCPAGWRQRLALGCAILHEPPIVFLDEPTGGVDPLSRRQFWRLIDELARSGVTVLVTTHYLDEAEHCHRIAIIQAGRLAALGTVAELKGIFAGRPILEIRATQPVEAMRVLEAMPEVEKTSIFGTAVHAVLRAGDHRPEQIAARLAAAGITVTDSTVVEPSLEDVFLDVALRSAA